MRPDTLDRRFFVRLRPPEACVRTLVERRDGAEGAPLASRIAKLWSIQFIFSLFLRRPRRQYQRSSTAGGMREGTQ